MLLKFNITFLKLVCSYQHSQSIYWICFLDFSFNLDPLFYFLLAICYGRNQNIFPVEWFTIWILMIGSHCLHNMFYPPIKWHLDGEALSDLGLTFCQGFIIHGAIYFHLHHIRRHIIQFSCSSFLAGNFDRGFKCFSLLIGLAKKFGL